MISFGIAFDCRISIEKGYLIRSRDWVASSIADPVIAKVKIDMVGFSKGEKSQPLPDSKVGVQNSLSHQLCGMS